MTLLSFLCNLPWHSQILAGVSEFSSYFCVSWVILDSVLWLEILGRIRVIKSGIES